jgi:uncharacterized protein (TIGR03083 family)
METELDFGPGARRLAELVGRVTDDEMAKPTPCPAYTLGDLIDHVGGLALAFTAAARKESGPYVEQAPSGQASRLEPGWRARISADLQTAARGLHRSSPARAEAPCSIWALSSAPIRIASPVK